MRRAADDDVKDCPICDNRDHLIIRWSSNSDSLIDETTEVGWVQCGKFFSSEEYAVAASNVAMTGLVRMPLSFRSTIS
jgi:hypothetical protein